MKYLVTRLDRRYSHSGSFDYMLEFSKNTRGNGTGVLDFDRARRWMNRTYGWSQDVEIQSAIKWLGSVRYRIYLASEKELTFFQLAHSGTE